MIKFNYKAILSNPFCVSIIFGLLGFLSFSFWGKDFKYVRILSSLFVFFYGINRLNDNNITNEHYYIKSFFFFCLACIPSILFASAKIQCAYKIFETFNMYIFLLLGIKYFEITDECNVFEFVMGYGVVQTAIAFLGYFFDPHSIMASDTVLHGRVAVKMLVCNYPMIRSNTLGLFGAICICVSLALWKVVNTKNLGIRFCLFTLTFVGIFVLYLSHSRTCMISAIVGLFFFINNNYSFQIKFFFSIIVLFLVLFFSLKVWDGILSFFLKSNTMSLLKDNENAINTLTSGRLEIWMELLKEPQKLIFGQGFGVATIEDDSTYSTNAHNSLVEIIFNSGIFSASFWLIFWYKIIRCYYKLKKYKDVLPYDWIYYDLSMAVIIMFIVRSFGNVNFVYFSEADFFIFGIVGLFAYSEKEIDNCTMIVYSNDH